MAADVCEATNFRNFLTPFKVFVRERFSKTEHRLRLIVILLHSTTKEHQRFWQKGMYAMTILTAALLIQLPCYQKRGTFEPFTRTCSKYLIFVFNCHVILETKREKTCCLVDWFCLRKQSVTQKASRIPKLSCYKGVCMLTLLFVSYSPGPSCSNVVSANPGLNFNPGFFFFLSKAHYRII